MFFILQDELSYEIRNRQCMHFAAVLQREDARIAYLCLFLLLSSFYFTVLIAASTTCPTSTDVVTAPTPPGTGVIAPTMGSTSS